MKVIKQGKPKEEAGKKITCTNCESELEYAEYDVITRNNRTTELVNKGKYIICPVCSQTIEVK